MFKNIIMSSIIFITSFSAQAALQTYTVKAKVSNIYGTLPSSLSTPLINDEITMTYILEDTTSPSSDINGDTYWQFSGGSANPVIDVSWANTTIRTSSFQSVTDLHVDHSTNNGTAIGVYKLGSFGHLEVNSIPTQDVAFVTLDLFSQGPYQTYTPWATPDVSKYFDKRMMIGGNGWQIDANITSIANAQQQAFAVWPSDGAMHATQQFDLFVTAPEGYNYIEFVADPIAPPLPIPCEIAPNAYGETEIKFLCRNLNAGSLQLFLANYHGVTIRIKNLATGQSLERIMNWRMVQ